jgi:hypothetical protein
MNTKRQMSDFAKVLGAAITIGAVAMVAAMPLLAHHSDQAHYDERQPVKLMGTVTKVQWANPHVQVNVDVKDSNGAVNNWLLELNSPNALMSQGWKVDSIKQGDVITAAGFRARDGSFAAIVRKVTLDTH